MIINITFGIIIATCIAIIAVGLVEDKQEEKHCNTLTAMRTGKMTVKDWQDYMGVNAHYDDKPLPPKKDIVTADGTIVREGSVYIQEHSD